MARYVMCQVTWSVTGDRSSAGDPSVKIYQITHPSPPHPIIVTPSSSTPSHHRLRRPISMSSSKSKTPAAAPKTPIAAPKTPSKDIKAKEQKLARAEERRETREMVVDLREVSQRQPVARQKARLKQKPETDGMEKERRIMLGLPPHMLRAISAKFPPKEELAAQVTTDSPGGVKTASGPGQSTVPEDRIQVDEPEEVDPAAVEQNGSIRGLSEEAVLDTVAAVMSDDAAGFLDQEEASSTAENEEPPPTAPEVEEQERSPRLKRKVRRDPVLRRRLRSNNRGWSVSTRRNAPFRTIGTGTPRTALKEIGAVMAKSRTPALRATIPLRTNALSPRTKTPFPRTRSLFKILPLLSPWTFPNPFLTLLPWRLSAPFPLRKILALLPPWMTQTLFTLRPPWMIQTPFTLRPPWSFPTPSLLPRIVALLA
jgi:hypothetical protein